MSASELKEMILTAILEFEKNSIGKNGDEAYRVTQAFCDEIRMIIRRRFWKGDPQYVSIAWGKDAMRDEIYKELEELWEKYGRRFVYSKDIHPEKFLLNKSLPFAEAVKTWFKEKDNITLESLVDNFKVLIQDYEDDMKGHMKFNWDEDALGAARTMEFTDDIMLLIEEEKYEKKPWDNEIFASRSKILEKLRNGIFASQKELMKSARRNFQGDEDFLVKLKTALEL